MTFSIAIASSTMTPTVIAMGEPGGHPVLLETDQGEGREEHHDALREVERLGGFEDQDESERHERIHDASQQPVRDDLGKEHRILRHVDERGDEKSGQSFHNGMDQSCTVPR